MAGTCESCKHYEDFSGDYGWCRRYPPTLIAGTLNIDSKTDMEVLADHTQFPVVMTTDWCGEFEKQQATTECGG